MMLIIMLTFRFLKNLKSLCSGSHDPSVGVSDPHEPSWSG